MQDRLKFLFITVFFILTMSSTVMGYTGKGTSTNPYLVSTESDFREILLQKSNGSSWVYVGINANISITKNITVTGGKFRIYANEKKRTIKRSNDLSTSINDATNPKYCIKISNYAEIVFGYSKTVYQLVLNGSADAFTGKRESSGWLNIADSSSATIDQYCVLKNTKNNEVSASSAPINCKGILTVYGEITDCSGINGGAINTTGSGNVTIGDTGKIHHCTATTEAGAVYVGEYGKLIMSGGDVYNCTANEEGGAFFFTDNSIVRLLSGKIRNNTAGNTGGGVFSGMGATLYVGDDDGTGPTISGNHAGVSGGGIRCNGGVGKAAGGTSYIYGGMVINNSADNYGGGISCANAGGVKSSQIAIRNVTVANNACGLNGGGIWIGNDVMGFRGNPIRIYHCQIYGNTSSNDAAGMKINSDVLSSENIIKDNSAKEHCGGVYINYEANYMMDSGQIYNNKCSGYGAGVYVNGSFEIMGEATVDAGNRVYLHTGTYINVTGRLATTNELIAVIESKEKSNGTGLVKISYGTATASAELYNEKNAEEEYQNDSVSKKFVPYGLSKNQCLRPTENVKGYDKQWIIISEKYQITYDGNSKEAVENIPETQRKFWNEDIVLSANEILRNGYILDESKHWNTKNDGSGIRVKPGSVFSYNNNITIYAQWIQIEPKELFITANDRYYVVGQTVILDANELLKKVFVEDDLKSGTIYKTQIISIALPKEDPFIVGREIVSENYIDTSRQAEYIVTILAENEKGSIEAKKTMHIFILDSPLCNNQVRFISLNYLDTLNKKSKWSLNLKDVLKNSLSQEQGIIKIDLSNEDIKQIKETVKSNHCKISKETNQKIVEQFNIKG